MLHVVGFIFLFLVPLQDTTESSGGKQETPLFIAAQHNREDMVKFLMKESQIQSSPNSEGVTPLMVALKEGNTEIVKILCQQESQRGNKQVKRFLEERDNNKRNVFHHAFGSRKPAEVTQTLVNVCSVNYPDYSQEMKYFLTAKDLNEDTPIHVLVQQPLEKDKFNNIFKSLRNIEESSEEILGDALSKISATDEDPASQNNKTRMTVSGILKCMKEKNERKETPLHKAAKKGQASFVEALLDLNHKSGSTVETAVELLLTEKDENGNTALHLATQKAKANQAKPKEAAKVLLDYIRNHTKDPLKYLAKKNSFGWTPFSGAVAGGDLEMVKDMLRGLSEAEKKTLVNQPDFSNAFPIHLAAKYGHVEIFNVLLENKAELTQRGRNQNRK